ncbi:hypothetical protein U1Q18_022460 [Sarracenia purpurea var. burkii]
MAAKPNMLHNLLPPTILIIFLIIVSQSSSSARPVNGFYPDSSLPATEPRPLNLALLGEHGGALSATTSEKDYSSDHRALPCDQMGSKTLGGRYGPLFLSMLPKGSVTPSGPSKGTDNVNN